MHDDEREIRELLDKWWQATRANDVGTLLGLMADDVKFLTPGNEPFGKHEFETTAHDRTMSVDGGTEIDELEVIDGWAWMRTRINVTMTLPTGESNQRSGCTLTILRKGPDGRWVIARDANLLPT